MSMQVASTKQGWERASRIQQVLELRLGEKDLTVPQIRSFFAKHPELAEELDKRTRFKDELLTQLLGQIKTFLGSPETPVESQPTIKSETKPRRGKLGRRRKQRAIAVRSVPVVRAAASNGQYDLLVELATLAKVHGGADKVQAAAQCLQKLFG
jgi:hypothetical protein